MESFGTNNIFSMSLWKLLPSFQASLSGRPNSWISTTAATCDILPSFGMRALEAVSSVVDCGVSKWHCKKSQTCTGRKKKSCTRAYEKPFWQNGGLKIFFDGCMSDVICNINKKYKHNSRTTRQKLSESLRDPTIHLPCLVPAFIVDLEALFEQVFERTMPDSAEVCLGSARCRQNSD